MKIAALLLASIALLGGCSTGPAATLQSTPAATRVVIDPIAAPGTIQGKITMRSCTADGANGPSNGGGSCDQIDPFKTTLAVVRPALKDGDQVTLVTYVTADEHGAFTVSVAPGRYTLVPKSLVTNDPNDATYATMLSVMPFVVAPGKTVTVDVEFLAPPPPISIGVGN